METISRNWGRLAVLGASLLVLAAVAVVSFGGDGDSGPSERAAPRALPAEPSRGSAARHRIRVTRDLPYAGPDGPALDVYRPSPGSAGRSPAVLVVHGGAWHAGDRADVAPTAEALARAGFVAFAVGYTLATPRRAGFPRQARELRAAVRFVRREAARFGIDPARVGALGISAGAHLAALIGTASSGPLTAGGRLGAVVAWSGPLELRAADLRGVLAPEIDAFLGCRECPRRAAAASPVTHVSGDDPPTMIVNSSDELVPASQARLMARRLREAGVRTRLLILPGSQHAPFFEPDVIVPTIAFLKQTLGRGR